VRRHLADRQYQIDEPGGDGALGHAVELGVGRFLGDGQPAMFLDHRHTDAAVGARAREDDADGLLAVGLGQGVEEVIDRRPMTALTLDVADPQMAVDGRQIAAGRDDVDVVRLDEQVPGDLLHRHADEGLQQVREHARLLRHQVDHHHVSQTAVPRGAGEELLQRIKTAGRGADADDRRLRIGILLIRHRLRAQVTALDVGR